ncbi:MAG TPA: transketolase C-terminal domain-containing protein [Bryobacteraceae bacterium]
MRKAFITTLCELAAADDRIVLMTGDLGHLAMEPFRERFPNRFLNVGVAEQNMIGLATGLAEAGFLPYAYSIATFAALRPLEFIRNGPVLHQLPVRIVGMGMGFEYGHSGPTHYGVEDVAVLRTLPGLTIVIPADSDQAANAISDTSKISGPVYYSLGKDDKITVPGLNGRFHLGKIQVTRTGGDIALVTMGSLSQEVAAAAEELSSRGLEAAVAVVSNFYPDPEDDLADFLSKVRHAVSVEAQTMSGGLGAFAAGIIASRGLQCKLRALGVRTPPDGTSGVQEERWRKHGIDRHGIVRTVHELISK